MKEIKESKEQLEDKIFNIFSRFRAESATDRRQVYIGQLWEPVYKWCLIMKKDMGEEIYNFILSITKEASRANVPYDKKEYFSYLYSSLETEKAGYYREYESGTIKLPKDKMSKLKQIEKKLEKEESERGRRLSNNEFSHLIHEHFNCNKSEYLKFIDLYNKKYIGSLQFISNVDDDEKDILNSSKVKTPYMKKLSNPGDELFFNTDLNILKEAIKYVLDKDPENKNSKRALLTFNCIENEELYPVLDRDIIEAWQKEGIKPKKNEIYHKYNPEGKKSSAGSSATQQLNEFLQDLKAYLKKQNPEIFHKNH